MPGGPNNFQQHPSQYSSVILNSASSVSQANQKNSSNTFGLGQINIRNKIIKPPVPAPQPIVTSEYRHMPLPGSQVPIEAKEQNI